MSTGQGVVLERSVFSDAVIGQSLYDNNLLSDAGMECTVKRDFLNKIYQGLFFK